MLSASERREIEREISEKRGENVEPGQEGGEQDGCGERAEEWDEGEGRDGVEDDGRGGGEDVGDMEVGEAGREMVNGGEHG